MKMETSKLRFGIKHNNKQTGNGQLSLFMIWREYLSFNEVYFAKCLFTTSNNKDRRITTGVITYVILLFMFGISVF